MCQFNSNSRDKNFDSSEIQNLSDFFTNKIVMVTASAIIAILFYKFIKMQGYRICYRENSTYISEHEMQRRENIYV